MERCERGFTLVETLIGATIAVFLIWGVLVLADRYAAASSELDARLTAQTSADRFVERLSSEAASAWAVFVPQNDIFGNANGDGHEIDFFTEDGSHRPYSWAYAFGAKTKTLTRYTYASNAAPVAGEVVGTLDAFSATAVDVTALADSASAAYDPLFASSIAPVVRYAFAAMPSASGGDGLVRVHLAANGVDRTELLASGTAPTSFTVTIAYTPSPVPQTTATPVPAQQQPFTP
jgi:Tfp pilus assembly protein PilV